MFADDGRGAATAILRRHRVSAGWAGVGTLMWMTAVLLDKNRVLPAWFGVLNICNLLTEFVVATCWTSRRGAFSWNGSIAFWVDTMVFVIYTCAFILFVGWASRVDSAQRCTR